MSFKGKTSRALAALLSLVMAFGLLGSAPVSGSAKAADELQIGAGIGDITGPITEISTGYNSLGDTMQGVMMKLYARAFVAADGDSRVCYVSAEIVHMTESIKPGVLKELKARGLGDYYTEENLMLAATHCHSSPSNTSWYALYDLVNGVPGFDDLYYKIVVQGIADAIENAHNSMQAGTIKIASGNIENAVYNRSLEAYNWNIDAEDFSETVNTEMTLLRFDGADGSAIGEFNWFGSHGTSNSIDNVLVSADHKGYAAFSFEQLMGSGFVAAFAQNESGDSSPNQPQEDVTADFLRPVDLDSSLDLIENEIVHGDKELSKALELYNRASQALSASVDCRHTNVDFSNIKVDPQYIGEYAMPYDDIENAYTGTPCIGAGIMAGDEEGAPVDSAAEGQVKNTFTLGDDGQWIKNEFNFTELQLSGLQYLLGPLWPVAQGFLGSNRHEELQKEKVVCLPVGDLMQTIQPLQIITIGELAIVGVPFEYTTMQARRTRAVLEETLAPAGITKVVFSTLTNSYSQYVTTREEYAAQNYEGSTVLFGPWSGSALTQELDTLCQSLVDGVPANAGPSAPDKTYSPIIKTSAAATGVVRDSGDFGKVITDVNAGYGYGEKVTAVFQGSAPRNVPQCRAWGTLDRFYPEGYSYMEVQQKTADGSWQTIRTEADPYTTFSWARDGANLSPKSLVTLTWLLKGDIENGTYRFKYNGLSKNIFGSYKAFSGVSSEFTVE